VAAAATFVLAVSAAPAAVDISQRFTGAAFADKGMKGFFTAMQALEQEQRDVLAGKLTELEADQRSRTIHAPVFRAVLSDLDQAALPPGDPRAPILAYSRRLTKLLLEALAMESVVDEASGKVSPADPARAAAIEAEVA
jgi:hypothetical protein